MDLEPDDEVIGEVEISFVPRSQVLADLGIGEDVFSAALLDALKKRDSREDADDPLPPLEEMLLNIHGVDFKLGDLAQIDVEIRGSIDIAPRQVGGTGR